MKIYSTSERTAAALDRACRHWVTAHQPRSEHASSRPYTIALSRQAGTQAITIANLVGQRLGWPVYDQELLRLIGEQMGLRDKLLESVDEKQVTWIQECVQAFSEAPGANASSYVHHLVELLFSLASHGQCVIVGRGAAQILPAETTLRVRLVGPLQDRVRATEEQFAIATKEARQLVDKTDRQRHQFVLDHFHKDAADPALYDVLLNPFRLSPEACADLIVESLHRLERLPALVPAAT